MPRVDRLPSRAPRRLPALGRPVDSRHQPGLERSRLATARLDADELSQGPLDSGDVAVVRRRLPRVGHGAQGLSPDQCLSPRRERRTREPVGDAPAREDGRAWGGAIAGRRRGGSLLRASSASRRVCRVGDRAP